MIRHGAGGLVAAIAIAVALCACDSQGPPPFDATATVDAADTRDATDTAEHADGADAVAPGTIFAGDVVWRRLNRTEYRNTVRDLVGTALDPGKDLPSDDLGYGFDNVASVLTMSPLHLELYERAARMMADEITIVPITSELRAIVEAESLTIVGDYGGPIDDAFVLWSPGTLETPVDVPRDGAYRFELRAWETPAGDERAKIVCWIDGTIAETVDLAEAPATYRIDLELVKGRHVLALEFLNDFYDPPNDRNAFIDWFGLSGPLTLDVYETSAWARHVACRPEVMAAGGAAASTCAEATVRTLASRAWRRPVEDADMASLMELYGDALADGAPGAEALGLPLQAILMSPRFLFKAELPRAGEALDGYEIATRLAYFIWSTMPDAALFEAAKAGRLDTEAGVAGEVERLLADPRAEALVANFAGQWLYIRDVDNAIPDPWTFPEFDDSLRHAMAEEMRLFFRSFVFEDRSMIELLSATDTFVNRRLAEHYGIDGPATDDDWQRLPVPGRHGVIAQAGLLMTLSTPFRTSIVRRGKWVLGQLLCSEPSSPPPDVVGLVDMPVAGEAPKTLREKMELHKTEERCRTCHQTMDAIGFGLEGFDGIGQARTHDNGYPVDTTGTVRGLAFDGAVELAGIIAEDPRLPACMIEKLMVYALGRGLTAEDQPLLDRIGAAFAARDHRFAALVELIATSEAFRRREVGR